MGEREGIKDGTSLGMSISDWTTSVDSACTDVESFIMVRENANADANCEILKD